MNVDANFVTALLIGLAGGVHCVGMCGGIALALKTATPQNVSHWPYTLMYHLGRISSYAIAGAITGGLSQIAATSAPYGVSILTLLSAIMLAALALYLGQWWQGLNYLEQVGSKLWKIIQPWSKRWLPFKSPLSALPYGMIWGWLPCGLVYSTLSWSLASGSPVNGALVMFFFGLGTLPALLAVNSGAVYVSNWFRTAWVRQTIAILMLLYASYLIYGMLAQF